MKKFIRQWLNVIEINYFLKSLKEHEARVERISRENGIALVNQLIEQYRANDELNLWNNFACSALASGSSPEEAKEKADAMLRIRNDRAG